MKELYLDCYAEEFTKAGFACVVYDNRNLGASDGEPRLELDPWLQTRLFGCYHVRPDSGRDRSGAHRHLGIELQRRPCTDRRGDRRSREMRRFAGAIDRRPRFPWFEVRTGITEAIPRRSNRRWSPPGMMAVVTQDPSVAAMSRKEDSYRFFISTGATRAPAWHNEITLHSLEYTAGIFRRLTRRAFRRSRLS